MPDDRPVILFDAGCNLCVGSVGFMKEHGGGDRFHFVPLGSPEADALLPEGAAGCDTLHLIDAEGRHDRSTAALRIAGRLRQPWASLRFFRFVPLGIRDAIYDFVASRRFEWFGRVSEDDSCKRR